MQTDKALRKALANQSQTLPYGFEKQIMAQISLNVAKKKHHGLIIGLSLVSLVSALLIAGGYYILYVYFSFNINFSLPDFSLRPESRSSLIFCVYIATIVLLLLVADTLFRRIKNQQETR